MEALDILSNNLANSNTGGYKVDREFYSLYQGEQTAPADGQQATTLPVIQKSESKASNMRAMVLPPSARAMRGVVADAAVAASVAEN